MRRVLWFLLFAVLAFPTAAQTTYSKSTLSGWDDAAIFPNVTGSIPPSALNALLHGVLNSVCVIDTGADCVLPAGAVATNLGFTPLAPANNLSDVLSASAARSHLGLGSLATLSTVDLTANVSNTLPGAHGGTGLTGFTRSGNTTTFPALDGSATSGHCPQFDSYGGLVDSGAGCGGGGGGGGSGTVNTGTAGALAYYPANGTAVSALTPGSGVVAALGNAANSANSFALLDGSGRVNVASMAGGSGYLDATFCNTPGEILGRTSSGWGCKRPYKIDVTDFGVVGDNSTVNDAAISVAQSAQAAIGAGSLYFPALHSGGGQAIYRHNVGVTLNADGTGVECESEKSVVLRGTGTTQHGVYINGSQHNFVRGCSFDYTQAQVCCGAAVLVNNAAFTDIANLHIGPQVGTTTYGAFHGVKVESSGLQTGTRITNVIAEDCAYDALSLGAASTAVVNEVTIVGFSSSRCTNGSIYGFINGIYEFGTSIYQGAHAFVFAPPTSQTTSGFFCVACIPDSTTGEAIAVYGPTQGSNGTAGDIHFDVSQCNSNYQCLHVYDGAKLRGMQISNSALDHNLYQAVYFGLVDHGPNSSPYQADLTLTDDHFCENSMSGSNNAPGVYFNSQGLIFTANISGLCGFLALDNFTGTGAAGLASTSYGLQFGSNVDRAIVTNNRFPNNTSGDFDHSATGNTNFVFANNGAW